jgi:hypothetical protein
MRPIQLSIHPGEPGYADWVALGPRRREVRVLLNGVELTYVISADEAKREVRRYATDERGHVMLNPARSEVITETLHGDVAIVLPEEAAA